MTEEITPHETSPETRKPEKAQPGQSGSTELTSRRHAFAVLCGIAGWLLPGLGHALQKMWGRAAIFFITVGALVLIGAGLRGNIFDSNASDAFASLGYLADLGTGSFYFVAKHLEVNGPDVSLARGDYGTRFLAAAGVLNLLSALHAYEAARGRKG